MPFDTTVLRANCIASSLAFYFSGPTGTTAASCFASRTGTNRHNAALCDLPRAQSPTSIEGAARWEQTADDIAAGPVYGAVHERRFQATIDVSVHLKYVKRRVA